jgi:hypothetical protein
LLALLPRRDFQVLGFDRIRDRAGGQGELSERPRNDGYVRPGDRMVEASTAASKRSQSSAGPRRPVPGRSS